MPGQWLTPDTPVPSLVAYRVYLPDDDMLRAAFFGAFALLTRSDSWELFGTMTPEQAARVFNDALLATANYATGLVECTAP